MVGWVCVNRLSGSLSVISMERESYDGIFLGQRMGVSSGPTIGDFRKIMEWTLAGRCGRCFGWKVHDESWVVNIYGWLVRIFLQYPSWGIRKELLLGSLKGPPAGIIRSVLVGNLEGEVVGETDGGVVGIFKR